MDDSEALAFPEVDTERANRLMRRILKLEESNNKTKILDDQDMIRRITKMVEEEADCY